MHARSSSLFVPECFNIVLSIGIYIVSEDRNVAILHEVKIEMLLFPANCIDCMIVSCAINEDHVIKIFAL